MTDQATPAKVRLTDGLGVCHPERDDAGEHALLERAAAAAGLVVESWITWGGAWVYPEGAAMNSDGEPPIQKWSPLEDDGDAFRLLIALDLELRQVHFKAHAGRQDQFWESVSHGDDKQAASRLATVQAAARIGRQQDAQRSR